MSEESSVVDDLHQHGYKDDEIYEVLSLGLSPQELEYYQGILRKRGVLVERFEGDVAKHLSKLQEYYLKKFGSVINYEKIKTIFSSLPAERVLLVTEDSLSTVVGDWYSENRTRSIDRREANTTTQYYSDSGEQVVKALAIESLQALLGAEYSSPLITDNYLLAAQKGDLRIKELGWPAILSGRYQTSYEDDYRVEAHGFSRLGAMVDTINRVIFIGVPQERDKSFDFTPYLYEEVAHLFLSKTPYIYKSAGTAVKQGIID